MTSNDLFGGFGNLGGLLGGLAKNVVPKDTAEGRLLSAQSELSDLQGQEAELLQAIGRQAYAGNPSAWPQDAKLRLIRQNMASAQAALDEAKQTQRMEQEAKAAEDAKSRCAACGYKNTEGVRFCQECGAPLGAPAKAFCISCGGELEAGTRFCGHCGARQGE